MFLSFHLVHLERETTGFLGKSIVHGRSLLRELLYKIKSRATYLNLEVSDTLTAEWDIPPLAGNHGNIHQIDASSDWNLFISRQEGFSVIFLNTHGVSNWTKTIVHEDDIQAAITLIIEASKDCGKLSISPDRYKLYMAMINSGCSPWKQRFETRSIADLVTTLQIFVLRPITRSNPWTKRAMRLKKF